MNNTIISVLSKTEQIFHLKWMFSWKLLLWYSPTIILEPQSSLLFFFNMYSLICFLSSGRLSFSARVLHNQNTFLQKAKGHLVFVPDSTLSLRDHTTMLLTVQYLKIVVSNPRQVQHWLCQYRGKQPLLTF